MFHHHMNDIIGKGEGCFVNNSTNHGSHINIGKRTKWRTFWVINEHTRTSNNGNVRKKKKQSKHGIDSPFAQKLNAQTQNLSHSSYPMYRMQ